jgi:acyl-CoA thioester hydrolase
MGYVYYGNYARFFEIGRVEAMRTLQIKYSEMEANGIMLPVSEFNVKYLRALKYDDIVKIETHIKLEKPTAIVFEYYLYVDTKLMAKGMTKHVFVSAETRKPVSIPEFVIKEISK